MELVRVRGQDWDLVARELNNRTPKLAKNKYEEVVARGYTPGAVTSGLPAPGADDVRHDRHGGPHSRAGAAGFASGKPRGKSEEGEDDEDDEDDDEADDEDKDESL